MDGLALTANYDIPAKPRTLSVSTTANLKSIRSVVLGKDGVGKSGMLKQSHPMFIFLVYVEKCL